MMAWDRLKNGYKKYTLPKTVLRQCDRVYKL